MKQPEPIDAALLIDELKGQRNAVSDQLALAGAIITKLTKDLADAKTLIDTLKKTE